MRRRSCVLLRPSNAPSSTFDALRRRAAHRRTHLRQPSNAPADPAWHLRACASSTVDAPWTHRRAPAATVERSTGHRRARQRQTSNAHHVADNGAQVARRTTGTTDALATACRWQRRHASGKQSAVASCRARVAGGSGAHLALMSGRALPRVTACDRPW
jgi:hypothetical protein